MIDPTGSPRQALNRPPHFNKLVCGEVTSNFKEYYIHTVQDRTAARKRERRQRYCCLREHAKLAKNAKSPSL